MIERLIAACFRKPALALLLALVGILVGALWLRDLRRDVFPDLSAPVFNVIVQNPAMAAEELETAIAIPLETGLAGLPGVRRIRSNSQLGVSQVTVEFEPDADYYRSRQFIAERVSQAAPNLPPGTDAPLISSLTGRLNEIFEFTLEAEPGAADLMTLRDLAEFEIKNRLLAVPGVAAVERLGGYLREFQVQLDPDRLSARRISLDDVLHAMEGANVNASGGFVTQASTEWTVRAIGRAASVDDLRRTVVNVRNAVPVFLGDVAEIREAPAIRRGIAHRLNGEVVSARVIKQFGADTVTVATGIRTALHDLQQALPRGVHLRVVYDQSALVDSALGGVSRAVLIGAGFVVVVLVALLGNVRAALLVTATLPASVALAGLLLKWLGVGINTMTLGGLAIAVGLLVDAAIIVIENILHRRRAQAAAVEVGRPIAFATLIIIAVFVPLYGMSGIEGRMYQPLAAAVIAAMAGALWLALTVVPLLAGMLLRRPAVSQAHVDADADADAGADAKANPDALLPSSSNAADDQADDEDVRLIRAIKRAYAPLLDRCLRHGWLTIALALLIALPVTALAFRIGSDFMPRLDEGALLLQTILPADSSLDQVDRSNHRVEDVLRQVPEVEDVVRRTGRAERTEDPMPHTLSDVLVVLKPDRTRPLDAIEDDMRARIAEVPGVGVLFTTPLGMRIDEGLGGTPADISVRIFGPDLDQLSKLATRAQGILTDIPGLTDLRAEALTGMPQVRIGIDREAAARVGLSPGDVIRAIRVGLVGEAGPEVWVGQRRFDLVVRLQDERRADLNAIRTLLVDGHDGTRIPLGQLAAIDQTFGPGTIRREAGSRRIAVEASVSGRDLGSAAAEARQRLDRDLALPAGYFYDVGGRVESQERAARSLRLAMALALFTVFVLLYVALDSIVDALLILCATPMAFVGSILALVLTGETWNVSSLVGLIGLFGIAVQNSLVLVTQTRGLMLDGGHTLVEAVREASIGRVRPKLMTAATAILGLLPLLVFPLHGTEIERPLAIVMTGGLITSTLFTLLVLPVLYAKVHQFAHHSEPANPPQRT